MNCTPSQTSAGERFTGHGLRQIFRRLAERTGITVTPHAMRRTFVILSLRAGIRELSLIYLLDHSSLVMVDDYASLEDDDLLQAHREHSLVDSL